LQETIFLVVSFGPSRHQYDHGENGKRKRKGKGKGKGKGKVKREGK
jgi:hypothetical protein